eukprot:4015105-Amphidinium_carterae.1
MVIKKVHGRATAKQLCGQENQIHSGAFRLLKPFCGSVTALQYFQKMPAAFQWLLDSSIEKPSEGNCISFDSLPLFADVLLQQ